MKHVLVFFTIILALIPAVYAEDDKWIDGIKIRYGQITSYTAFIMPGEKNDYIIRTDLNFLEETFLFPITIALPETVYELTVLGKTGYLYGGFVFEWYPPNEINDLSPVDDSEISSTTKQLRQKAKFRTLLYNDFFNDNDRAFVDANPNWAMSADVSSSAVFLGYYFGNLITIFDYHRIFKFGFGIGAYYNDFSYKLNLCSQYKVTPKFKNGKVTQNGYVGECLGKTEIDSASGKLYGMSWIFNITLWERYTKDSVWKIGSGTVSFNQNKNFEALKLKNHDKYLNVEMSSNAFEYISYTYRF